MHEIPIDEIISSVIPFTFILCVSSICVSDCMADNFNTEISAWVSIRKMS